MEPTTGYTIASGFEPAHRATAVRLFWEAFKGKLAPVMRPEPRALSFFSQVVDPAYAISAISDDGRLLGLAGFKTASGAFVGGKLNDLASHYGMVGGLWRGVFLSVFDRPIEAGVLLMDGIFVNSAERGRGLGSALLSALKTKARADGCDTIRLDVIDTNPQARALYLRHGFEDRRTYTIGALRHVFGFRSATTMTCDAGASAHSR